MIRILFLLALVGIAMVFGPIASEHKGYVVIHLPPRVIEMTAVSFLLSLAGLVLAYWFVEWIIRKILRISNSSVLWLSNRKQRKALQQTNDGMLALAAQDWRNAEKLLSKSARNSHTPELNYLVAAEAAKQQGKTKQQEKYVALIGESSSSTLAVAMTKARLADDDASRKEAKDELEHWLTKQPKQATLLLQLAKLYQELKLWQEWLELLPSLKKHTQVDVEELTQQEHQAYHHRFAEIAEQQDLNALDGYWSGLGKELQRTPEIFASYCAAQRELGGAGRIEEKLYESLCKSPQQALLEEWFLLHISEPEAKLMKVKKLHKKHSAEHNSFIGLTALHAKRWDEAIHYLQQALNLHVTSRDRLALAQALEQSGQVIEALEMYKKMVG